MSGYRSPAAPPRPVMPSRTKAPWTEAHKREALRRTYEIAAEFVGTDSQSPVQRGETLMADCVSRNLGTAHHGEGTWRAHLMYMANFDAARIDREVRRVRALAEGRLVRETVWACGGVIRPEEQARAVSREHGWPLVRVDRIRRPR